MTEEKKKIRTTPKGIACFPFLSEAKKGLDGKERFSVNLRLDPKDAESKKFLTGLSKEMKAVHPKGNLPYRKELDRDTDEETGMVLVAFSCLEKYPMKLFDRWNKKIEVGEVNIGYGSEIKVAFIVNLYELKEFKKKGMNLYLQGVQILDLIEYQGRTAEDMGFEVEEEPQENEGGNTAEVDENGNPSDEEVPF